MPADFNQLLYKGVDPSNNPVEAAFSGYHEGLQRAMKLQAQQAELDYKKTENEQRKQDLAFKSFQMINNGLTDAMTEQNPSLQKAKFKGLQTMAPKINQEPPSDAFLSQAAGSPDFQAKYAKIQPLLDNPATRMDAMQLMLQIRLAANPQDAATLMNTLSDHADKLKQTQALWGAKTAAQTDKDMSPFMSGEEKVSMIERSRGQTFPPDVRATMVAAQDKLVAAEAQKRQDKSANINSQIDTRANQSSNRDIRTADAKTYHTALLEMAKGRMQQRDRSLGLQTSKMAEQVLNRLDTSTKDFSTQLVATTKGMDILSNPNPNWVTFKESLTDLASLTQAKPSAVVPIAREAGVNPSTLQGDIDRIRTYYGSKLEGAPSAEYRAQIQESFERLHRVLSTVYEKRVNHGLARAVIDNAMTKDQAISNYQFYMDNFKISNTPGLRLSPRAAAEKPSPGSPAAEAAPPAGARAGQVALKAVNPATIPGLMKNLAVPGDTDGSKTKGAVKAFLEQRGYDPSGVK